MSLRCYRIKLKPDSSAHVKDWQSELANRRSDVEETLLDEVVTIEAYWLEKASDGDYLIAIMCSDDFEQAQKASKDSKHDIDVVHRQFKQDSWEEVVELDQLLEFDVTKGDN